MEQSDAVPLDSTVYPGSYLQGYSPLGRVVGSAAPDGSTPNHLVRGGLAHQGIGRIPDELRRLRVGSSRLVTVSNSDSSIGPIATCGALPTPSTSDFHSKGY